jgi:hypothetical protein
MSPSTGECLLSQIFTLSVSLNGRRQKMYVLHESGPAQYHQNEQMGAMICATRGLQPKAFNPVQALPLNLVRILRPRCS